MTKFLIAAVAGLTVPARAHDQSGNLTGLFIAEESAPNTLPGAPVFHEREPNSYSDFGGSFTTTTRKPITHDRQHAKGDVSDNSPTAGWTEDLTPTNMRRLMQGFLFADAREKPSTRPLNGTAVVITTVAHTSPDGYTAAAGLTRFIAGHLLYASGFADPANNGLKRATAVVTGKVTVAETLVADASPAATATLEAVGFQFPAADVVVSLPTGKVRLTSTAGGVLALGLNLGGYVGVVGLAATGDNAPFYGRVSYFDDYVIEFDKTTGVQAVDTGVGKTVQIYFGTVVRNEDDCTIIKRRTYTLERQYGCGAAAQSEYVTGWTPNQITITIPTPGADAKVTLAVTGIADRSGERIGSGGGEAVLTAAGGASVIGALNEPCFKPGLDVYRHKLAVLDNTTLNPTGLVAYNTEASLVINNNVSGSKAIEVFGNSDANVGDFDVSGSLTAYWTSVAATRKVRQGAELTWDLILTKANSAVVFDIASLGLGNGRPTVEANTPVRLPLDTAAGKGKFGYTLLTTFLRYVPAALMAQ